MVPEARWRRSAQKAGETDLPSRGFEQVNATNYIGDILVRIVHRHGKLIRPVAQSIAQQQVAALFAWFLHTLAQQPIDEALFSGIDPQSPSHPVFERNALIATSARVPEF